MSLYEFDRTIRLAAGIEALCGVDEAGRGPLAGPVYAAAVILPDSPEIEGLNDSKQLSEKKREKLYQIIVDQALAYCIAQVGPAEIDRVNILQASLGAMRTAVKELPLRPDLVLVDGNADPCMEDVDIELVVKGDTKSACIAAASILAKVARDRAMGELDREYPEYGFARHKGYPTKEHYQMLDRYGPCPIHRQSFLRKWAQQQLDV